MSSCQKARDCGVRERERAAVKFVNQRVAYCSHITGRAGAFTGARGLARALRVALALGGLVVHPIEDLLDRLALD